jgi:hypothetical protein
MLDRLRKLFRRKASTPPIESVMLFLHHSRDFVGPFHVSSHGPAASCVRLKDGRLHVYQRGEFPDLLEGPEYILAGRALADVLRSACGRSLEIVPAQVINVATGEIATRDHFDVLPHEEITPETLQAVDSTASRAWHFRKSHLFVTKQVVLELQRAGFTSLQFDPGFSGFCGGVASAG